MRKIDILGLSGSKKDPLVGRKDGAYSRTLGRLPFIKLTKNIKVWLAGMKGEVSKARAGQEPHGPRGITAVPRMPILLYTPTDNQQMSLGIAKAVRCATCASVFELHTKYTGTENRIE